MRFYVIHDSRTVKIGVPWNFQWGVVVGWLGDAKTKNTFE